MINLYMTDEISRVRITNDMNGVPTNSTLTGIKARVEDYNKMIRDINGNEVMGDQLIIVDNSIDITYEDKIIITKKNGITYDLNAKQFAIKKIENAHGFINSHKEIYI